MAEEDGSTKNNRPQDMFGPGGKLGPVEDRNELELRVNSLPSGERELAQESARFADLCQYFERQKIDIPSGIVDQLGRTSRLPIPERVDEMKKLNQQLMEYLNGVSEDPGIRQ